MFTLKFAGRNDLDDEDGDGDVVGRCLMFRVLARFWGTLKLAMQPPNEAVTLQDISTAT